MKDLRVNSTVIPLIILARSRDWVLVLKHLLTVLFVILCSPLLTASIYAGGSAEDASNADSDAEQITFVGSTPVGQAGNELIAAQNPVVTLQREWADCLLIGGEVISNRSQTWHGCELKSSVTFPRFDFPIKTFTVIIRTSGITVDCNNNQFEVPDVTQPIHGMVIQSRFTQVSDVTVKNCRFLNFKGSLGVIPGLTAEERFEMSINLQHDEIRARAPTRITLDNIVSENARGVGIGITATYVTLKNSRIFGSRSAGIYLSWTARNNLIKENHIHNNGREGIAIDSARYNIIKNNEIHNNRVGAIMLYRNCQERFQERPPGLTDEEYKKYKYHPLSQYRHQGASNNLITQNVIRNELIGVWIASRQSRDLRKWGCGNPTPYANHSNPGETDGKYVFLDYANTNAVKTNHFINVNKGIIVEGNRSYIFDNTFYGVDLPARVGTKYRSLLLGKPVRDTKFDKNRYLASPKRVDVLYNSRNTTIDRNWTAHKLFSIVAMNSAKCINVKNESRDNGAAIQQWQCKSIGAQLFQFVAKNGHFKIKNILTRKCLDVTGSSLKNGALLQQRRCSVDDKNQLFDLVPVQKGKVQIVAIHSGKCLNVKNQGTSNGDLIQQWSCSSGSSEMIFELQPHSYVKLRNRCKGVLCDDTPQSPPQG